MTTATPAPLVLYAPLDGWCSSLDDAPDAVFSGRLLGDGVAIDPTGSIVHAPCDGEVILLPVSRHAVTLRTSTGIEVLVHVGIDTVAQHGAGFEALVGVGAQVRAGDPLLRFDLDGLAQRVTSLVTPVVVLGEGRRVEPLVTAAFVRVGQPLARIHAVATEAGGGASAAGTHSSAGIGTAATAISSRTVVVALAHGLHARPAARIAQAARAATARVTLRHGTREADARSVTALMTLGARQGDTVELRGEGPGASGALAQIAAVLTTPEAAVGPTPPGADARADLPSIGPATPADVVPAVIASRGLALGPVHWLRASTFDVPPDGRGVMQEMAALREALRSVRAGLLGDAATAGTSHRELAAAHALLLDDPVLVEAAERDIERGHSAGHAWRTATTAQAQELERLDDAYLRERVADLHDLERQVLTALGLACAPTGTRTLPDGAIVVAHDILPSQFSALDLTRLAGLCTVAGGATSHVAILAGSAGLPMLVAAGPELADVADGTVVLLDAQTGRLHLAPDAALRATAAARIADARTRREHERLAAQREARTADGTRVLVYANLGAPGEASQALALGAEGCGLLRSEFLFLDRTTAPGEDEQLAMYQETAARLGGRTLTIRTLDVGGDKPLDYLPMPHEDNPALGLRGVRTSLFRPELLREQLRAILRVQPAGQCRILLPMVTDAAELGAVRVELARCVGELGLPQPPPLGVMIETPAAAVLADTLASQADFLSLGTNDLTQYTLAMDRTHPRLAARLDGLHPAVLRLIASVCEAARRHGREVAVCGNLALDEAAIPILLGLGVHELSVAYAYVPAVKARLATLEIDRCRALAQRALQAATAEDVRRLAEPTPATSSIGTPAKLMPTVTQP
ncbi:MAG TPA: phosphoenolpyruvate--protein phosphotransferase [Steroidobacteraceae bacterium]|nr:phosphoenolpyruvate--protein phosphotransferase [Steroidobacteraceae bacterium]